MGRTTVRAKDGMPRGEVVALCTRLGITPDVLGSDRRYLLVTASARPGVRQAVALYATKDEARAAFVRFRQAEPGEGPWAELAELDTDGGVRRLCWFGASTGPTNRKETDEDLHDKATNGRPWSGLRRRLVRRHVRRPGGG